MEIRVAIVEDDSNVREGLVMLISGVSRFRCVGDYGDAESALYALPDARPDVVLLDIGLPQLSGIECLRILKPKMPGTQFVMITGSSESSQVFQALAAGATGYVVKMSSPVEVLQAIEEVHAGGSPMSAKIARVVVEYFASGGQAAEQDVESGKLSTREHEIVSHLCRGRRYKEIAGDLNISVETVRTHLRRIYEKLQVRSRTEAVVKYMAGRPPTTSGGRAGAS
jgi:DNA-binding NarL/FixJ family response regulator